MGDRANVFIQDPYAEELPNGHRQGVYLYTHDYGHRLPDVVATALDSKAGRGRHSDGAYLTRIIFDHVLGYYKEDAAEPSETGAGVSASIQDDNYGKVITVDPKSGRVAIVAIGLERNPVSSGFGYSFDEFIAKFKGKAGWDE